MVRTIFSVFPSPFEFRFPLPFSLACSPPLLPRWPTAKRPCLSWVRELLVFRVPEKDLSLLPPFVTAYFPWYSGMALSGVVTSLLIFPPELWSTCVIPRLQEVALPFISSIFHSFSCLPLPHSQSLSRFGISSTTTLFPWTYVAFPQAWFGPFPIFLQMGLLRSCMFGVFIGISSSWQVSGCRWSYQPINFPLTVPHFVPRRSSRRRYFPIIFPYPSGFRFSRRSVLLFFSLPDCSGP